MALPIGRRKKPGRVYQVVNADRSSCRNIHITLHGVQKSAHLEKSCSSRILIQWTTTIELDVCYARIRCAGQSWVATWRRLAR
jgi:hypothetical protein